jgi:hypothetical protein
MPDYDGYDEINAKLLVSDAYACWRNDPGGVIQYPLGVPPFASSCPEY